MNTNEADAVDRRCAPPRPTHNGCPQPRPDWVPNDAGPEFATWLLQGARPTSAPRKTGGPRRRALTLDEYVEGVLARDRTTLGRAISLVESSVPAHQELAQQLLTRLLPHAGGARRIGITGIPGVGKSTFIESFGCAVVDEGHRVAVLAVDPTSTISGGSILADKLRMEKLCRRSDAYIRPSPTGGSLGGVARKTREAIVVCEAAGFDVVIVETVGVGQNEVTVRSMTDFFLVLMIAGAGDEFQGIKKGVIELADALVINKADGDNRARSTATQAEMQQVLRYLQRPTEGWETPALLASALTGDGVRAVWQATEAFFTCTRASGVGQARRQAQAVEWMHALVAEGLRQRFYASASVQEGLPAIERAVGAGQLPATAAALELLKRA